MYLYHYFDRSCGPFRNISDAGQEEAQRILDDIRKHKPRSLCAKRQESYIQDRLRYEKMLREAFIKKGGTIQRNAPQYMVVEACPWLETWYEDPACISIPIEEFDVHTLSFTYGDSHPTFSEKVHDGREYRKKLYVYDEILEIIHKYGLPQDWNRDGRLGPERYVEVQVWSDATLMKYM